MFEGTSKSGNSHDNCVRLGHAVSTNTQMQKVKMEKDKNLPVGFEHQNGVGIRYIDAVLDHRSSQ